MSAATVNQRCESAFLLPAAENSYSVPALFWWAVHASAGARLWSEVDSHWNGFNLRLWKYIYFCIPWPVGKYCFEYQDEVMGLDGGENITERISLVFKLIKIYYSIFWVRNIITVLDFLNKLLREIQNLVEKIYWQSTTWTSICFCLHRH